MPKQCSNCGFSKVWSKGLCLRCHNRAYPVYIKRSTKRINPVSDKRKQELHLYNTVSRPEYLAEHKYCEIGYEGCLKIADQVHHMEGRENHLLNKIESFRAACGPCHEKATEHSKQAIADGHSISKHKVKQ